MRHPLEMGDWWSGEVGGWPTPVEERGGGGAGIMKVTKKKKGLLEIHGPAALFAFTTNRFWIWK